MKSIPPRNERWETVRRLPMFAVAALLFSTIGYFLLMWAFPVFSRRYLGTLDWNMLGGYVSVITLALFAGGLAFAFAEYTDKENANRREKAKLSYDIYRAIFEKLTDPENEAARRWILANIRVKQPEEDIADWYQETQARIMSRFGGGESAGLPEGQSAVKLTLNCLDYIGFIANHYWEIDDDSLDWISPPIAKVWRRIGPYVEHIRTLRKARDYYLSAEYIGKRCIEWRRSRGLPDEEYASGTL
jgi:hypothetical protein